jgi:hypothetical protein
MAGGICPVVLLETQVNVLRESVCLKPTLDLTKFFQVKVQFIIK